MKIILTITHVFRWLPRLEYSVEKKQNLVRAERGRRQVEMDIACGKQPSSNLFSFAWYYLFSRKNCEINCLTGYENVAYSNGGEKLEL